MDSHRVYVLATIVLVLAIFGLVACAPDFQITCFDVGKRITDSSQSINGNEDFAQLTSYKKETLCKEAWNYANVQSPNALLTVKYFHVGNDGGAYAGILCSENPRIAIIKRDGVVTVFKSK